MNMDDVPVAQDPPNTPTRVEDLWFATDVVIIRAENKIFRVMGGILAARSTVFRDMIAFPQPEDSDIEKIDGFPVVRLYDSAEDVEVFLRAIFDSGYFMPAPAPFPLFATLGILRLSHKYDVLFLHRRALDHLAKDGWYRITYGGPNVTDHLTLSLHDDSLKVNFSIISAALEVNAPWLLPWPYYCAATHSAEMLLPFMEGPTAPHALKALAAHAHLVRGMIDIEGSLTIREPCANAERCDRARDSALVRVFRHVSEAGLDPLPSKTEFGQNISPKLTADGRCSQCIQSLRTKHHEAASVFWDQLPSIFGLQPWKDLHAMAQAAMRDDPAERVSQ
ncbi:BTB domain-containing protein [Mycena sanguinolenta]|uniref:BTB domain-containing protein n=1 Tax=Mycena sanguinolenta TaxID=230812 RepID=A0A8H6YLB3_9AGAR|nr:BTB domain-containing protein [Mycena sanguinolenta]